MEGAFHNGYQHGFGRCIEPNGNLFEGVYKAGDRDGTGTLTYRDGHKLEGIWKKGGYEPTGDFMLKRKTTMMKGLENYV